MRVTQTFVDELRERLGDRDWQLLEIVDRLGTVSAGQLRRIHWPRPNQHRTARRRLQQLSELRILGRLSRRIGGVRAGSDGHIYRLDVAGRRLLGYPLSRRPHTPGRKFLNHALGVSEIYTEAIEAERHTDLEVIAFATEPACWREWASGILKPDAHLVTAIGDVEHHRFIEIDCATESSATLIRKAATYETYLATGLEQEQLGIFPSVLWIVPSHRRRSQLADVLASRPAELWRLHHIALPTEVPRLLTERTEP